MKILVADITHPLLITLLEQAGFSCDCPYHWTAEEIEKNLHHYDGIVIRSKIKITRNIIDNASRLKCIARVGAGMENIDVAYAESRGIQCLHVPEGNRDAVGEHALGMLLALMNNICKADAEVRQGKWIREDNRGHELSGKTVGIIGYGNMGSAFARKLKGFDVQVLAYDKYKKGFSDEYARESSLETIYTKADVVSLHIPLTPETHYMANDLFFSSFKKEIWFINTARGKAVTTSSLVKYLKSGKIKGACLDVLEYETTSFEHIDSTELPDDFQYLIRSNRVILTPHIAGWTHESNEKMAQLLAGKIIKLFGREV